MTFQPTPLKPALPRPGDILLGRYVIEGVVGRGGYGSVYRGRQLGVDRTVAIKCLDPDSTQLDPAAPQRFAREARLASGLEHPNTITIFDYGRTEDGILFLVMEFVEGVALDRLLRNQGCVEPDRAARFVRQILHSLREAHAKGIIHRDLKPANIMVCDRAGEHDVIKVLDFGIAKAIHDEAGGIDITAELTGSGRIIGTPRYMSPEQIRGERLAPSSDLYTVGLILSEMLSGRPAIDNDSSMAVLGAQLSSEPVAILRDGSIPLSFLPILEKALQKSARSRFQSANEFLGALDVAPSGAYPVATARLSPEKQRVVGSDAATVPMDLDHVRSLGDLTETRPTPQISGSSAAERAYGQPYPQRPTGSLVILNVLLGCLLLMVGIIFGVLVLPKLAQNVDQPVAESREAPATVPEALTPAQRVPVEPLSPPPAAAVQEPPVSDVVVVFSGQPADAEIFMGSNRLGAAGTEIILDREVLPAEVEIRSPNHRPYYALLTPNSGGTVQYSLQRLSSPPPSRSNRSMSSSVSPRVEVRARRPAPPPPFESEEPERGPADLVPIVRHRTSATQRERLPSLGESSTTRRLPSLDDPPGETSRQLPSIDDGSRTRSLPVLGETSFEASEPSRSESTIVPIE
jgi:serine/threonine-protein kinase